MVACPFNHSSQEARQEDPCKLQYSLIYRLHSETVWKYQPTHTHTKIHTHIHVHIHTHKMQRDFGLHSEILSKKKEKRKHTKERKLN